MTKTSIIIVGGGAAGMVAAISAKRAGHSVVLFEKLPQLGKKVLASGAGRCNLLNEDLDSSFYNPEGQPLAKNAFTHFGKEKIQEFFRELGLLTYTAQDGRIFPVTNQAVTVAEVLKNEITRLNTKVELHAEIKKIHASDNGFEIETRSKKKMCASRLILCCGGRTYPALGSDGGGYSLAASFGHKIIEPVPIAVPLAVSDPWCHRLQGQKIRARAATLIHGKMGRWIDGEVLFTKYGLSGTAVIDASPDISIELNRRHSKKISIAVDLVPFLAEADLLSELERKIEKGLSGEALLSGILPPKFSLLLRDYLKPKRIRELAALLKKRVFTVEGTRGWNEADFTAGGIDPREVNGETLESKLQKGLYLAGEILNVHGCRGGYNLAWAWASGYIAGKGR